MDKLFSADERNTVRRLAHTKTVDDLLFEATMEAVYRKEPAKSGPRK